MKSLDGVIRQPVLELVEGFFARKNLHPHQLAFSAISPGNSRIQHRLCSAPDIRTNAITFDERDDGIFRDHQLALLMGDPGTLRGNLVGGLFHFMSSFTCKISMQPAGMDRLTCLTCLHVAIIIENIQKWDTVPLNGTYNLDMADESLKTVQRAIALLDSFTLEHPEMGVREAARLIHSSPSTTGRLLLALKNAGILNQDPNTKSYSLGGKVLSWAGVYSSGLDVRHKALPAMEQLHHATQETISLYVLEGDVRVCVERLESTHSVRIVARIGRRLPLYAGSAGKLFLAFLNPERRAEILDRTAWEALTEKTITNRQQLEAELVIIKAQGYAVSHGEWLSEASGIAAPIFDQDGEVIASLVISGPTQRFSDEKIAQYIPEVTGVAAEVSRAMGYRHF